MKKTTLTILDEVNARFSGLDPKTRRKMVAELKFFVPWAYHLPSFKLGRWDGTISFCSMGGRTNVNLLDKVLPIVIDAGYEIELVDNRKEYDFQFEPVDVNIVSDCSWPEGHEDAGKPIVLRDYQVDVLNVFIEHLQCVQEVATGAGKTILTATMSKMVEKYGRTIVIVPNKSLVKQTEEDYKLLGLDVGVYYGDRKEYNKTHTICTWQSLNIMDQKGKEYDENLIEQFLDGVVCVMVDEVHAAKADVLKRLLTGPFANCPIRWGLTGTVPKEDFNFSSILAAIGEVKNRLAAHELQELDVLAKCHVNVIQLQDSAQFRDYHEEHKHLVTNQEHLEYLAYKIRQVSETGNTLVLIDRIPTGEALEQLIEGSVFVRGAMKVDDRKEHYDEIKTSDSKIIIATYGVASVGINIPRIFNLVLLEPGKSFVRVIQSIGRGIRKAKDKDYVNIWDICASTKYSKRHLTARKKFYKEAQYPFSIKKIDYIDELKNKGKE